MWDWVHFSSQRRSWAPLALGDTCSCHSAAPSSNLARTPPLRLPGPPSSSTPLPLAAPRAAVTGNDLRLPAARSPESRTSESRLCPPLPRLWPRVPVLPTAAAAARLFPFVSTARGHFPLRLLSASRVSPPSSPCIALRARSWPISSCPSEMPHFWMGPMVPFGTRLTAAGWNWRK